MYHRAVNDRLLFKQLTMLIVKIYTLLLFVLSSVTNINCEMHRDKQLIHSSRSSRQFRPILGSIVFLLASNLVAKGVLGLNAYNSYIPNHNNIQGSLYVQFGQKPTHQHQVVPYDPSYWNPTRPAPTRSPQPVHQQQIINILESPPLDDYSDVDDTQPMSKNPGNFLNNKFKREVPRCINIQKREAQKMESGRNKQRNMMDLLCFSAEQQEAIRKFLNIKRDAAKRKQQTKEIPSRRNQQIVENDMETTTVSNYDDVEYVDDVTSSPDVTTIGRQMQSTTPTTVTTPSTTVSSTTPSTTITSPSSATTRTTRPTTSMPTTIMMNNETGYNYSVNGYGPYTGNENVSLTTTSPGTSMTTMMTGNETNATTPTYYPSGQYGPSNGNENISITYGPPSFYDHIYKPFSSSPIDYFLHNQYQHDSGHYHHKYDQKHYEQNHEYNHNQEEHKHENNHYDNNYYEPAPSGYGYNQFPDATKYNDIINKFYNKYDYHYPAGFNKYFKK